VGVDVGPLPSRVYTSFARGLFGVVIGSVL